MINENFFVESKIKENILKEKIEEIENLEKANYNFI